MTEDVIPTTLPHASFGDPDCGGCLCTVVRGDEAVIVCNECRTVLATLPALELQRSFGQMRLSLDAVIAHCPHCSAVHVIVGFSKPDAYVCEKCGRGMTIDDREAALFQDLRDEIIALSALVSSLSKSGSTICSSD